MARTRSSSAAAALRASSSSSPTSNTSNPSSPAIAPGMASISASSNHNNNSISYLAPFVASVLRDQVVADLYAELKRKDEIIQQQAEDRLRLEVTGQNGDLVYCKTSMKDCDSFTDPDGTPLWHIFFGARHGTTTVPNFVETVAGLELRVGGIVVFKFNGAIFCKRSVEMTGFDRTRDDELQMGNVQFFNSDYDIRVCSRVGPMRYEDYVTVPRRMHVSDLVRFLKDHQTNNNTDTVLLPQLQIQSVHVHESQINGILPLLNDTMGETSTSE